MKRIGALVVVISILLTILCSCQARGPYSAPLHQPPEEIVKVELVDGRNEAELFKNESYSNFVICTLDSEQIAVFIEGLQSVEFYMPSLEPSRHLGEIAVRIYYKDGCSDLIGSNCNYYYDSEFKYLDSGVYYPDKDSFYSLFAQFVDSTLLPRK